MRPRLASSPQRRSVRVILSQQYAELLAAILGTRLFGMVLIRAMKASQCSGLRSNSVMIIPAGNDIAFSSAA
jgi:hypothetical protein